MGPMSDCNYYRLSERERETLESTDRLGLCVTTNNQQLAGTHQLTSETMRRMKIEIVEL